MTGDELKIRRRDERESTFGALNVTEKMYAVRFDRSPKFGGHFLSCDRHGPVALFYSQSDAIQHAKESKKEGMIGACVMPVTVKITQCGRVTRRGLLARRAGGEKSE